MATLGVARTRDTGRDCDALPVSFSDQTVRRDSDCPIGPLPRGLGRARPGGRAGATAGAAGLASAGKVRAIDANDEA